MARVRGGVKGADADHRNHAGDVGVGLNRGFGLPLHALHFCKRDVGADLRHGRDRAGVLQWQEAFGDDDVEQDRGGQSRQRHKERCALAAQYPEQTLVIEFYGPLDKVVEAFRQRTRLALAAMRAQQPAAHHGRQCQRYDSRGHNGDGQCQGEFAEHAANEAGHEKQRNENRDQRQRQRNYSEADLFGAAQCRFQRAFAILDMAYDIFNHHDGVVDHETGADCQRHQREIIQRESTEPHHAESRDQR